jgi:FtsP/CotA-like multicopper oxidase with cupredoxin domain
MRLKEAVDTNPDPGVVEISLEARLAEVEVAPGRRVEAWTYDGGLPGPLIRVPVGARLVVHFTNRLSEPTTVHWHGIRVPIEMDGVPDVSQPAVRTGESFTYDFVVPDAGLYWYHPHVMSAAQVGFGLYGALLVEDPTEQVGVSDEVVLVLSDIGIEPGGTLESAESGGSAGMVFGREGNHVLVNGRTDRALMARSGARQRWRVVNAAKSRYFEVSLQGHTFLRIGGDGGLLETPTQHETVVLAAGERADLIVTPTGAPGTSTVVRSLLFNRGYGSIEFRDVPTLFTLSMDERPAVQAPPLPRIGRTIAPLALDGATPLGIDLALNAENRYMINGRPFGPRQPLTAKLGETQIWTVTNTTDWSHPLHLHGFFFQVLDASGAPRRPLEWKDTVDVPFKGKVQLAVHFDERPGSWMIHCHILDHADGGLMTTIQVGDGVPAVDHSSHTKR